MEELPRPERHPLSHSNESVILPDLRELYHRSQYSSRNRKETDFYKCFTLLVSICVNVALAYFLFDVIRNRKDATLVRIKRDLHPRMDNVSNLSRKSVYFSRKHKSKETLSKIMLARQAGIMKFQTERCFEQKKNNETFSGMTCRDQITLKDKSEWFLAFGAAYTCRSNANILFKNGDGFALEEISIPHDMRRKSCDSAYILDFFKKSEKQHYKTLQSYVNSSKIVECTICTMT